MLRVYIKGSSCCYEQVFERVASIKTENNILMAYDKHEELIAGVNMDNVAWFEFA